MNSRVIAAIAAALLAVVGLAAVVVYASSANKRAFEGAEMVKVYRVTAEVPANSDAETVEKSVEAVSLPNSAVAKGAIRNLATLEGLKTTVPLVEGEQLIESRFDESGSQVTTKSNVPEGLQEVAVTVDAAAGVSEKIDTGVRVGVIATAEADDDRRGQMVAQNILVTGVKRNDDGTMVVTLAVNTSQATQVAVAAQFGQVRLSVQNDKTDRSGGTSVEVGSLVK